jgi:galactose mutarotase-like enzyme
MTDVNPDECLTLSNLMGMASNIPPWGAEQASLGRRSCSRPTLLFFVLVLELCKGIFNLLLLLPWAAIKWNP